MIVIIGAMEVEVEKLKELMDIDEIKTIASMQFYIGKLYSQDVVVVRCRPGKVNSAICTQIAIQNFNPSLVINPGVAGGIGENTEIGDLVVAKSCCQHDFDTTVFGSPVGEVPTEMGDIVYFPCDENYAKTFFDFAQLVYEGNVHFGIVASGDQFIANHDKCAEINSQFSAIACEMESASIAHVCYLNEIPYVALRSISDNANGSGTVDFVTFVKESAYKTSELLKKFFTSL